MYPGNYKMLLHWNLETYLELSVRGSQYQSIKTASLIIDSRDNVIIVNLVLLIVWEVSFLTGIAS
jgi:hypothetical protein